jgi:hypothetical protein
MVMGFNRLEISERRMRVLYQWKPFGRLFDDGSVRGMWNNKAQRSIVFCTAIIQAVRFARHFVEIMAMSREIPSRSLRHFCSLFASRLIDKLKVDYARE